jgi:phosphoribosyl 1,2-cyclic phosphate phosphodiesterase
VDGVCFTHTHYDHVAGVDELRIFYLRTDRAVPCLLSRESFADLHERYAYLFRPQGTGSVAAQLEIDLLEGESGERMFLGVPLRFFSYSQANVKVTGYRIGDFAYVTDIKEFDVDIFRHFKGVRRLVLSALEPTSSRCHLSIQEAIDFAEASGVEETWLTHLSHRVDYAAVSAQLPPRVHLGYDGLVLPVGGISHG